MSNVYYAKKFWDNFASAWPKYYDMIMRDPTSLDRILNLVNILADELNKEIDFEFTFGEINRVPLSNAKAIVEMYISPKLLLKNVPLIEYMVECAPNLPNLNIIKYRSYHTRNELIEHIDYNLAHGTGGPPQIHTYNYSDFGCQWFSGVEKTNDANNTHTTLRPLINIVVLVKHNATNLLTRRPVTFILDDGKEEVIEKWLPTNANVIDILLINIIGEYNLVHNVGYMEFMPEDDPLIAPGSEFHELSDLRAAFQMLNNNKRVLTCQVCSRYEWQMKLSRCSKCMKTIYCSKTCQKFDYNSHKNICKK